MGRPMIIYADTLEQAQAARNILESDLDIKVKRVDVAANEVGRDRVAATAHGSYDARDDSSDDSDDSSAVSWGVPAVLKTAISSSVRQSVSSKQDGSSSQPASEVGGGDVVAERDSTAGRDSGGGGGVVAGRDSTAGQPDDFPETSFSATPAPRFSMASQRPRQSMQNSECKEKTKSSERTSPSFDNKSQKTEANFTAKGHFQHCQSRAHQ